jgi:membrane protease subunit (stomatin/prohibitin family)
MPKLMEILEFFDNSGSIMVKRVPENEECEIKWGAQLIVRESQKVIFFRDGKSLDIFGPGRYVLKTLNVPLISKWVTQFGYGPQSPFRSEVYFLNMKLFPNLKWGTPQPILFKDTELKMIRLGAHGIFSIQITDPTLFLNKVVGTQGLYHNNDIENYLKNIIITRMTDVFGKEVKTVYDIPKEFNQLSLIIKTKLELDFEGLGLNLHDFSIKSISIPTLVQKMIDERTGKEAIGNLDEYLKKKIADALGPAAENPSGTASTGLGAGMGLGMGFKLFDLLKSGSSQSNDRAINLSPLDKIKKLKELHDQGIITEQEYENTKKKLLQEI